MGRGQWKVSFFKKEYFQHIQNPKRLLFLRTIEETFQPFAHEKPAIFTMKDCPEIEELLLRVIGDDVVGFFERKVATSEQEVRVFTPVYGHEKNPQLVN